jgi:hypothetical protein
MSHLQISEGNILKRAGVKRPLSISPTPPDEMDYTAATALQQVYAQTVQCILYTA